jgi:hypothetical protein
MIDTVTLAKARSEIGRLNKELVDLHVEEDRLKLKRGRIESERARVQTLVDMCELAQRLAETPVEHAVPSFHIERVAGAKVVVVDKPPLRGTPVRKHKPDGLPTVSAMVITALQETGKASRPAEITDYVRKRWWPSVHTKIINAQVWHMAKAGKLTCHDGRYGLNGAGH